MSTDAPQPNRRRLAAAMIVRDEQETVAATIESVKAIADDIYVLDTGSTDRTPAIAEDLGARVGQVPWSDDFAGARNLLLGEIDADWILWLDAGEQLDVATADQLRAFVDQEALPDRVYTIFVEIPSADPTASSEQAALDRLLPRHTDLRYTGRVRETLRPAMVELEMQLDAAPGRIVRDIRRSVPEKKNQKAKRDLRLIELEASESDHVRSALLLAKGDAHGILDQKEESQLAYAEAIRLAVPKSTEMLEAYYGLLTAFDGEENGLDRQVAICLESLEQFPLDAQLLCAMGNYLQAKDRLDLSTRSFDTAVKYGQVDLETWHLKDLAEVVAACLSISLQLQGNDAEAGRVLEESLASQPDSVRIRRHLVDFHIKQAQTDEALATVEGLSMETEAMESLRRAIRGACRAVSQDWVAALGYLQSAYLAGCRDPWCLRWLTVTLLSNGEIQAAAPVIDEWLKLEPANAEALTYAGVLTQHTAETPETASPDATRTLRIDPGTSVFEVGPAPAPALHRALSPEVD